eukprot:TRINITY_DN5087_c3_g1_i1.p1 TRINITY_DN5087_c3_g1~~TRINITY_DN5087_c3_g1_i1.p1  ORF type:complete len:405 (+),score=86.25 TRINITY_DN5087_c3_g1_i1:57-1217(+)
MAKPRWADIVDSSQEAGAEDDLSRIFLRGDDSYHGEPVEDLDNSKKGLNLRLTNSTSLESAPKDFAFLLQRSSNSRGTDGAMSPLDETGLAAASCSTDVAAQSHGHGASGFVPVISDPCQFPSIPSSCSGCSHGSTSEKSSIDSAGSVEAAFPAPASAPSSGRAGKRRSSRRAGARQKRHQPERVPDGKRPKAQPSGAASSSSSGPSSSWLSGQASGHLFSSSGPSSSSSSSAPRVPVMVGLLPGSGTGNGPPGLASPVVPRAPGEVTAPHVVQMPGVVTTGAPSDAGTEEQSMPQASEEDWQHREEKRRRALVIVKATDGYKAYAAAKPPSQRSASEPKTPDAADRNMSKRRWELEVQQWRGSLRRWCSENGVLQDGDQGEEGDL